MWNVISGNMAAMLSIDPTRLTEAYQKARADLLAERYPDGRWTGELSTSALATATAVSALSLVARYGEPSNDHARELAERGLGWLAAHQNSDGGWGDTEKSHSNIATTMLAVAAFHLGGGAAKHLGLLVAAEEYIDEHGHTDGLKKRYGKDKTFAVPILTNCALAGLVAWKDVSPLPFELACVPQKFYRFCRMPVVSYAIPALVAIGQARFFHQPPWNPIMRWIRRASVKRSISVLHRMQPDSGGYLEAVPLTSFVMMSLAATKRADHPVTQSGVRFLIDSVRKDGSWPIDTNLATWNTTLSVNALAGCSGADDVAKHVSIEWLLSCQHRQRHPFTGADPGGWGWSDLSGAVPDADDTPGALLALRHLNDAPSCDETQAEKIRSAVSAGVTWLLGLQNGNGGWPTFCRGWGKLPVDRSGNDLTAHAIRAMSTWRGEQPIDVQRRIDRAIGRGFAYLQRNQQDDGSWTPLWFGNQDHPHEENPVYGTAKVLMAYRDLNQRDTPAAQRGFEFLSAEQNEDGGWGGGQSLAKRTGRGPSSVEETALATEALLANFADRSLQTTVKKGVEWLVESTLGNLHHDDSPIGFYFAKLWYHERLYPLIFTVSALGQALDIVLPPNNLPADKTHLNNV